jgi:hypothetical protein
VVRSPEPSHDACRSGEPIERVRPEDAAPLYARVARHIIDLMTETDSLDALGRGLAALAPRLKPDAAALAAEHAIGRMADVLDPKTRTALDKALAALAQQCRDPQLGQLLKHPRCVGPARKTVNAEVNRRKK